MWNQHLFMTRDQMREYDRLAMQELGLSGLVLMENAGRSVASLAAKMCTPMGRIAIVVGPGNNGGDGFVIARHLLNGGFDVDVCLAVERNSVKGDALVNARILEQIGHPFAEFVRPDQTGELEQCLRRADLVVDALLGTGVTRNVEGHLAELIGAINRSTRPVLAVDIPSGLDADSGRPWGECVQATATCTLGHLKRGLVIHPGVALAGDVHVAPIGVPSSVSLQAGYDGMLLQQDTVREFLPKRPTDAHKGTFGHLLVLAGSLGKSGAAALVGDAAMRIGTGLVTIATTAQAQPVLEAKCLEVMVDNVIERTDAPLNEKVNTRLEQLLEGKKAVALGPGISTAPGISALTLRLLQMAEVPAVVDADGINILAKDPTGTGRISAPMVLTPHPGEMARLLNKTVARIQADRIGNAREAARWHQIVVVLKGARTVVAAPDGSVFVNPTGNPGMASGGTGDALTGIIGGFLAQGLSPLDAALLGVFLHGLAGDRAAALIGRPGLLASDLIAQLPKILKEWTSS